MNTIKLARSLEIASEENQSPSLARDPAQADVRSLGDWELALVAGGDGTPVWPS